MIKPKNTILFQGDSITDTGRSRITAGPLSSIDLGFGYPRIIADHLQKEYTDCQLNFFNRGVSGDRIRDMAYRWERDTIDIQPDLISILIGVNDTWNYLFSGMGSSPEEYSLVYEELLNATIGSLPDVQLVLCEPFLLITGEVSQEWEEDLVVRQESVKRLAREFGAVFVPFQSALNAASQQIPARQLLDDGVHPTDQGHEVLAGCWLDSVLG
jgi:lysophospholipase L1-like esterase